MHSQSILFFEEHFTLKVFQSHFETLHCTESALLKVFNDVPLATDSSDCVILELLDLTAAFDTVVYDILLTRWEQWVGYADDSQIYVPLKESDAYSKNLFLKCLEDLIAKMALNLLNFNESKTEVIVFGGTTGSSLRLLGPVQQIDWEESGG